MSQRSQIFQLGPFEHTGTRLNDVKIRDPFKALLLNPSPNGIDSRISESDRNFRM